jgi:vancomycin resistance protein YoaR
VLAVAWLGLYLAAGSGIARGTTVLGVAIGGQSQEQATATLSRELRDDERAAIPVTAADVRARVRPARAGLALDVDATVAAAQARSWNPVHLLSALFGAGEVEPVVAMDRPALRAAVDGLAGTVDRPAVEGSLRFGAAGTPKPVQPVEGRALSRRQSVDALAEAYLVGTYLAGTPVELPVAVDEPEVSRAEVTRVAEQIALPATSADVVVTVAGTALTLTPQDIAAALTFTPDGKGSLQPVLDGTALHTALGEELAALENPARDATFRVRSGTPRVVPARQGQEVLPDTLSGAVLPVLTESGAARAVTVPLEPSEPTVSTATAQGLGVTERVSSFTTYYPSDFPPRLQNIHRAADLMDRTLVLPGKVFSLNRTVGERTAERGFAAGYIIDNGQLEVDFGGGVSQLVTTTFNAAYFAALEFVEHHPHSFYISRYPEGREATVAWGVKDLRFRNDSPNGIFITTSYTSSSVTVSIYGTKRYRIESVKGPRYDVKPFTIVNDTRGEGVNQGDCVATEGVSGFRVVVTRLFYEGNTRVRSEEFRTKYEPENEVRCKVDTPEPPPPQDDDEPDAGAR